MLLLNFDDELNAFSAFVNLMQNRNCFGFYRFDIKIIENYKCSFNHFLKIYLPLIYNHFQEQKISVEMFFVDWYLSLFGKSFTLDNSARFMDSFLTEGEVYILRTSLGLLHYYQSELLKMQIENIMKFLIQLPRDLNYDDLLNSISKYDCITGMKYEQIQLQMAMEDGEYNNNSISSSNSINGICDVM